MQNTQKINIFSLMADARFIAKEVFKTIPINSEADIPDAVMTAIQSWPPFAYLEIDYLFRVTKLSETIILKKIANGVIFNGNLQKSLLNFYVPGITFTLQ
jgi:hypothetical protein